MNETIIYFISASYSFPLFLVSSIEIVNKYLHRKMRGACILRKTNIKITTTILTHYT